jgi:MGT family glycosyltransferase
MSRILFVNGNLHGHINPTLPIIKELVRRGDEVYYFSTVEFKPKIEAAGAVFLDYGKELEHFVHTFHPHGNHPFYTVMEYMLGFDRTIVPIVISRTKHMHFDLLVHDIMFGGGPFLANKLMLPAIASCSSFLLEKPPLPPHMLDPGFHPQLDLLRKDLEAVAKEWEIDSLTIEEIFCKKEPHNLIYTSRLFHPQGDSYDDTYCFVGPSIADRNEVLDLPFNLSGGGKLIYITLGTILNNNIDFYNQCIDAFRDTDYQVVLSIGSKTEVSSLKSLPDNIIARNYVPQLELLQHTQLMISHGGLNSVSESLYYGVPIIAIPLANDQPAVAKRLQELGTGLSLRLEDITPDSLRHQADTITSSPEYYERCNQISLSFQQAGGYEKAADYIRALIR